MYKLKGGAVPIPRWVLLFRFLQFIFTALVLGLTSYAISINDGGPLRAGLIALLIISVLTLFPILTFTTPLHISQRCIYDPRIALVLDGIATLFWLGAFAALAFYERVFRSYAYFYSDQFFEKRATFYDGWRCDGRRCRHAWRAGVAATVFGGCEFVLFLFTTVVFLYYYHRHMVGVPLSSTTAHHKGESEAAVAGGAGAGSGVGAGTHHEGYAMHPMPAATGPTGAANGNGVGVHQNGPSAVGTNDSGVLGNAGDYGRHNEASHNERPAREAPYGGMQD